MGIYSNYLRDALNNHVLRNTAYTPAATVYLALFSSDPSDVGSLTGELSGGSYARVAITFGASSGGSCPNSADVNFPTASADWTTATYFGICDASTSGHILFHGILPLSLVIKNGQTAKFPAGAIVVTPQ